MKADKPPRSDFRASKVKKHEEQLSKLWKKRRSFPKARLRAQVAMVRFFRSL